MLSNASALVSRLEALNSAIQSAGCCHFSNSSNSRSDPSFINLGITNLLEVHAKLPFVERPTGLDIHNLTFPRFVGRGPMEAIGPGYLLRTKRTDLQAQPRLARGLKHYGE